MPKRQKSKSSNTNTNPLSNARKGASSRQNGNKADDLWHRKSGAGYNLFIQYYGSQPCGVVAHEADFEGAGGHCRLSADKGHDEVTAKHRGMSRASKKRQKKKAKLSANTDNSGANAVTNESDHASSASQIMQQNAQDKFPNLPIVQADKTSSSTHPLIEAFATHSNCPHLSSYVHCLATSLPLTFRIRKNQPDSSKELEETLLKEHYNRIAPVSYDPSKQIYQSTKSSSLSKSTLGNNPKLKEDIVNASLNGVIARQEIGSMLPVLALHSVRAITTGSKVLDLCASPGSKTLQALEIVAQNGKGRIIANDVHSSRLDSLREAVARSGLSDSFTERVTYTNYDASVFPPPKSGKLFDAIICDVPCSGDGTIRKDKHILPLWTPNTGNELHGLQVKILNRALELIKCGGVVCYSTCSLNPVEDEAVVSAALQTSNKDGMKFELIEWPEDLLPGFIRRPGVNDWKVGFYDHANAEGGTDDYGSINFFANTTEAGDAGNLDVDTTLWPLKPQIEQVRMDRCVRLFPQDNDTGGFFLVLIKRLK